MTATGGGGGYVVVKNMTQEGGQDNGRGRPMSAEPVLMLLMVLIY